jgi:hypothetical protein
VTPSPPSEPFHPQAYLDLPGCQVLGLAVQGA